MNLIKIIITLSVLIIGSENLFSMGSPYTPAADVCGSATGLTPNTACTNWTTDGQGVAGDPTNSCYAGTESQTVWWQFTATSASMNLNIQDLSVNCAPAVAVYSGGCGGLTEIICQQFTSATSSFIMAPLVSTNTYFVALSYQTGGPCSDFIDVCIDVCDTPPNDVCNGSTSISGTPLSTDNFCTTPGPTLNTPTITPADLCAGSLENTAWFEFTVSATADVVITFDNIVCVGGGAGFQIGYFIGACGSLTNLGCSSGSGGTVVTTITGLNAGDVVTMAVDGNAGADCTFDLSATNTVALPIKLVEFTAEVIDNSYVELDWLTATEINNEFFTIERTRDGEIFEVVGIVDGAGNSNMVNNYSLNDENPYKGTSYYRLSQTDYDGTTVRSDMIAVNIESSFGDLTILPNPVKGLGYLSFNSNSNDNIAEIVIYDVAGKRILSQKYIATKGNNKFELPTTTLPQGMYFLTVGNNREISNIKFIKD